MENTNTLTNDDYHDYHNEKDEDHNEKLKESDNDNEEHISVKINEVPKWLQSSALYQDILENKHNNNLVTVFTDNDETVIRLPSYYFMDEPNTSTEDLALHTYKICDFWGVNIIPDKLILFFIYGLLCDDSTISNLDEFSLLVDYIQFFEFSTDYFRFEEIEKYCPNFTSPEMKIKIKTTLNKLRIPCDRTDEFFILPYYRGINNPGKIKNISAYCWL